MKKLLRFVLIIVVLFSTSNNVLAQTSINTGLKVGMNIANFSLDPKSLYDYSNYTGIVAGFYLDVDIWGPIGFQGELLFSQKGAKFNTGAEDVTINLNYIEIPILLKYSILKGTTFSFEIQGGPYFGQKLSEKWTRFSNKPEQDFFKNSDYGITLGVGVKFNALFNYVYIDTRYSKGLADISLDNGEVKNKNLVIIAGIGF